VLYLSEKIPENEKVEFEKKVREVSQNLDIDPNWLMALMDLESAGTFSPSITNSIGCVGLIQFCPDTPGGSSKRIGSSNVSFASLKAMSRVQQMDYVESYLRSQMKSFGKPKSFVDLQLMIFLPAAIKFDYDEPIFIRSTAFTDSVKRNNPMYVDGNGNITKRSIEDVYKKRYAGLFEKVEIATKQAAVAVEKKLGENKMPLLISGVFLVTSSILFISIFTNRNKTTTLKN